MIELRDYQRKALDDLYTHNETEEGNPLIVLPTGSGKSLVIAQLCKEVIEYHPKARILIATHVKELIKQDHDELLRLWPDAPVGIYSAGLNRRDANAQILFGGVQSIFNKVDRIGMFNLMIVDEAHLVPHRDSSTYRRLISNLRELNGVMRVVGLTATAFRLDSGRLDEGDDALFSCVVSEAGVGDLIKAGWLCKLTSKATVMKLNTKGVGVRGGEYIPHELELAVDQEWITSGACKEIIEFGKDRRGWLVFCTGVKHAGNVARTLQELGVNCATLLGTTPKVERDRLVEMFRRGEVQCLVSVMVLGTGFNVPHVDMIALLRPTKSAGLFLQQVGRGLRNAEGKADCLVLDFAGLVKTHGPVDQITSSSASKTKKSDGDDGEDNAKECPACHSLWPLGTMLCEDCGHVWPAPKPRLPKHDARADDKNTILSSDQSLVWLRVERASYEIHRKYNDPFAFPTLHIQFKCGASWISEYLNFEKPGAAYYARRKWFEMRGKDPVPRNAQEALSRIEEGELTAPNEIRTERNGRFLNVAARRYRRKDAAE